MTSSSSKLKTLTQWKIKFQKRVYKQFLFVPDGAETVRGEYNPANCLGVAQDYSDMLPLPVDVQCDGTVKGFSESCTAVHKALHSLCGLQSGDTFNTGTVYQIKLSYLVFFRYSRTVDLILAFKRSVM